MQRLLQLIRGFPRRSVYDLSTVRQIASQPEGKRLGRAEFQGLGEVPPELEWFANLDNPRTRWAYRNDVKDFTAFAGVERPEEMRQVTRAHLIGVPLSSEPKRTLSAFSPDVSFAGEQRTF